MLSIDRFVNSGSPAYKNMQRGAVGFHALAAHCQAYRIQEQTGLGFYVEF